MGMHQMLGPSFGAGADYEIERSLRFNAADSANLSKSFSSAGNTKTWTWSAWVKFNNNSGTQVILNSANGNNFHSLYLNSNSKLKWDDVIGGSNVQINLIPDLLIRDFAAWYHIVLAVDTTQSTAADRNKMYINGVQVTYESGNNFGQNDISQFNQGSAFTCNIGSGYNASYTNAYLADVQFIDGTQLAASSFAEYDDDNNWVPKKYSGSYGSNGYHLKFDDNSTSAALGTDSSGNNNTWTVNNLVAAGGVALPGARTSVFFDGTDDKITYTSNSDLNPGATFTLEAWVYRLDSQEIPVYYGTSAGHVGFRVLSNGGMGVERINTAFDLNYNGSGTSVPNNAWTHVAWTKTGGTLRVFINGSNVATTTNNNYSYQGNFVTARTLNDNRKFAISDLHLVVGTALYTSNFTPPSTITAHANTKLLCFQNASSATTATVAPYGVTLTATSSPVPGAYPTSENYQIDSLLDSPTNYEADSGNNGGNYCCWNPLSTRGPTFTEGNLTVENGGSGASGWRNVASTLAVSSGKWYAEFDTVGSQSGGLFLGVQKVPEDNSQFNPASFSNNFVGMTANSYSLNCFNGSKRTNSSDSSYGSGMSSGDKIMLALDLDNGKIWWGKNGTWFASGDPDSGTNAAFTGLTGTFVFALGISSNEKIHSNWGQRPFAYSNNISGFKSVCTMNFAEPTIADGSTAFDIQTYNGTGASQTLGGLSFAADFFWRKCRSANQYHNLVDSVRGLSNALITNGTFTEQTGQSNVSNVTSTGYDIGTEGAINTNGATYVAWLWDAGTSTVSNTTGDINSNVRANQSAGFSIVSYTGNGSIGQTIGHGLNAVPQLIIAKSRSASIRWGVYHKDVGPGNTLVLNSTTTPTGGTGVWGNTVPTNTVFTVSNDGEANANGGNYIAYCFAPVEGYSAIGSYQGNGLTDGSFIYTGFRPALIITKRTDSTGGWVLWDTARNIFNVATEELYPDDPSAEYTGGGMDILSNGFKLRNASAHENNSGGTYIYAAFAEHPLKTSRAR